MDNAYNSEVPQPALPQVSWGEFQQHNQEADAWVCVDDRVYDVAEWAQEHPGGAEILLKFAGEDASDQFAAFHPSHVRQYILPRFAKAEIRPQSGKPKDTEMTKDYRELREDLYLRGFFEPNSSYFARKHFVWLLLVICGVAGVRAQFVWGDDTTPWFWLQAVFSPILIGLGLHQAAFLAHDAAHNGVQTRQARGKYNMLAWLMASPVFGISAWRWNDEHSMHHAITLRPLEDPQFNYLPIWLISPKELEAGFQLDRISRLLISVQHITFLPVCLLIGRINLYILSIWYAVCRLPSTKAIFDLAGISVYWTWNVALLSMMPHWHWCVCFMLIKSWVIGILHVQLLLNHLATETFTAEEERIEQFAAFQVRASRNIACKPEWDWVHGGLQFQIEHHLFPTLPRHNLRKIQPEVRALCAKHHVPYLSQSFWAGLWDCITELHGIAVLVRTGKLPAGCTPVNAPAPLMPLPVVPAGAVAGAEQEGKEKESKEKASKESKESKESTMVSSMDTSDGSSAGDVQNSPTASWTSDEVNRPTMDQLVDDLSRNLLAAR